MYHENKIEGTIFYHHAKVNRPMSMAEPHYHQHHELYYLLSGERKYFIGNQMITVRQGDIVLIPSGVLHKTTYVSPGSHERLLINFTDDERFGNALACFARIQIHIPQPNRRAVEELFLHIEREYQTPDSYSPALIQCYLYQLLTLLCRMDKNMYSEKPNGQTEQLIRDSAEYISNHYADAITLSSIAKKAAMSPGYYSKSFKRITGLRFCEYLTYVRIQSACPLLENTPLPITEVAARCGFSDSNYFASVFKRIKGITPKKYRQSAIPQKS